MIDTHFSFAEQASLTYVDGDVNLLKYASKTPEGGPSPRALFEGEYYTWKKAQLGDKVGQGDIVRTGSGKARLIYENGDQIMVSAGTHFRFMPQAKNQIKLGYGALRSVVEKKGPRSGLQIRTQSATMGVRGTDFYVSDLGEKDSGTELSVIAGEVEIEKGSDKKTMASGWTAGAQNEIEVYRTSKEVLREIATETVIPEQDLKEKREQLKPEIRKEVEKLETKAKAVSITQLAAIDATKVAALKTDAHSLDQLNHAILTPLMKQAPDTPRKRKPIRKELENLGEDAYRKYFKVTD